LRTAFRSLRVTRTDDARNVQRSRQQLH
jgi:hypothetical protein